MSTIREHLGRLEVGDSPEENMNSTKPKANKTSIVADKYVDRHSCTCSSINSISSHELRENKSGSSKPTADVARRSSRIAKGPKSKASKAVVGAAKNSIAGTASVDEPLPAAPKAQKTKVLTEPKQQIVHLLYSCSSDASNEAEAQDTDRSSSTAASTTRPTKTLPKPRAQTKAKVEANKPATKTTRRKTTGKVAVAEDVAPTGNRHLFDVEFEQIDRSVGPIQDTLHDIYEWLDDTTRPPRNTLIQDIDSGLRELEKIRDLVQAVMTAWGKPVPKGLDAGRNVAKKTRTIAFVTKKRPRDDDNDSADDDERHHSRQRLDTPEPQDTFGQGQSSTSVGHNRAVEGEEMQEERGPKRFRNDDGCSGWKGKGKETTAHRDFPEERSAPRQEQNGLFLLLDAIRILSTQPPTTEHAASGSLVAPPTTPHTPKGGIPQHHQSTQQTS